MHYVYIIKSKINNKIYLGSTRDLVRRLAEHNGGKEFSTRQSKPWEVVYYEAYLDEKSARIREKRLKYNGNAKKELKKRLNLQTDTKAQAHKRKSGAGFTLVELMAVTFIIALISALVLANYRNGQNQYVLNEQTQSLAQFIRDAQNRAMASSASDVSSAVPIAYGVAFVPSQFPNQAILYADINGDNKYSSAGGDVIIKRFNLDKVSIKGISGDLGCSSLTSNANIYISFIPPNPDTVIQSDAGICNNVNMTINLPTQSGLTDKIVSIYNTGLVQIQ